MAKTKSEQVKGITFGLYRVNQALAEIMDMIAQNDGEVTDAVSESLQHFIAKNEKHIEDAAMLYHQLNSEITTIETEIQRLKSLATERQKKIEALTQALKKVIPAGKNIETPLFTIKWRKSSQLQVDDFAIDWNELEQLGLVKITKTVDKIQARQLLKEKQVLPQGLSLVTVDNMIIK